MKLNFKTRHLFFLLGGGVLIIVICLGFLYNFFRRNPIARIPLLEPVAELPDGYKWQLEDGPDFYIYRAQHPNTSAGVGIYFGNMPNSSIQDLASDEDLPSQRDHVASQAVSWIVLDGKEKVTGHLFYRTTMLEYQYTIYMPLKLHIWVYADDQSDLEELLHSLESLRFTKRN